MWPAGLHLCGQPALGLTIPGHTRHSSFMHSVQHIQRTMSNTKHTTSLALLGVTTANAATKPAAAGMRKIAKAGDIILVAGTKKTKASGKAGAGDVISVARDGGTTEIAEVLDIDPRTGMASLWYDETGKAETGVKLSGIKYAIKERYVEPVPQNQDLLDCSDVAPDAPKYEPDDPQMLLQLMSGSLTLEGVSYDENLLH